MYTYEEYLELEMASEGRVEYHFGEVFALAGSSKRHNRIVLRMHTLLDETFSKRPCEVFALDIKAEIHPRGKYLYPDLVVTCDPEDIAHEEEMMVRKPTLIIEVLSKGTESRDRNEKFKTYIKIPSLQYYLLVSQEETHVELYARQSHDFWHYTAYSDPDAIIPLPVLETELPLSRIYP